VDVAIIGAGLAGIAAGLKVKAARKRYVILEAQNHIGGRTVTDTTSFPGIKWDLGCQWFHFVTPDLEHPGHTHNPLFDIALHQRKRVFPDLNPRILYAAPRAPVNFEDSSFPPVLLEVAADIVPAGAAASLGLGPDKSAAAASADVAHNYGYKLVSGLLTVLGAGPDELSCEDIYNESEGGALLPPVVPSIDNWLIPSGFGAFAVSLARGLNIHTGTGVKTIDWRGKDGVVLDTPGGKIHAKTVIVTVPLGPLAAGNPGFTPGLPSRYSDAIHRQLKMGHVTKIGLLFADGFTLDVPQDNTFANPNRDSTDTPILQARAFGHQNFAILIACGQKIADIEASGQLGEYAREQIRFMFGSGAAAAIKSVVPTSWNTSRYSLGAYSLAVPGGVPGRRQLARPLATKIFFAGEAVSVFQHSSSPGAWTTGQDAARNALRALG
jgi:monoamine oxidase